VIIYVDDKVIVDKNGDVYGIITAGARKAMERFLIKTVRLSGNFRFLLPTSVRSEVARRLDSFC
jgi:hypothetical protein